MANPVESVPYGFVKTFTPVLDTSAYADNDTLFDATEITDFFPENGKATLLSVVIHDAADQGASVDIDLYFFNASVTFGTINNAISISDADALKCLGHVSIATATDSADLINSYLYTKTQIGLQLEAAGQADTVAGPRRKRSLWVAGAVRAGTPTYAASSLQIKLGYV